MQIKQLRQVYNVLYIVTMLLCVALFVFFVLFLVSAFEDNGYSSAFESLSVTVLLLVAVIFVVIGLMLGIVIKIAMVFGFQINDRLDADAAMSVYTEFMKIISRKKGNRGYQVLLSQILDLKGDYTEALNQFLPRKAAHISRRNKIRLVYFYLRCGMLDDAHSIIQPLETKLEKLTSNDPVQLHTAGLYYLETGNLKKAKEYLIVAIFLEKNAPLGSSRISRLNCAYDLARLEEKEGNLEKAIEHYQQAAAIGPKAWLGQEAARRAEALAPSTQANL